MDVFISWSGQRSKAVAAALHEELPKFVHGLIPFMSDIDIDKGKRSIEEIKGHLGVSGCGIFCITPENVHREWLNFEGGAISVKVDGNVWTYLTGVLKGSLSGPLALFQDTLATKEETLKLVESIHRRSHTGTKPQVIVETFEHFWPDLEKKLGKVPQFPLPRVGSAVILEPADNSIVPARWVEMSGKFYGEQQDFWLLGKRGANEFWPHGRLKWNKDKTWKEGVGYGENKEIKQVLAWVSPQMNAVLESWKRLCKETETWKVPLCLKPALTDFIEVDWRSFKVESTGR